MERSELIPLDVMMQALIEAKSPQDLITLASKAEALRHYARKAKLGLDAQNRCAEIKLRAERQLGNLLAETARSPGQRDQMFRLGTFRIPKLSELGIDDRKVSHRAQAIASVPERQFERYIKEAKEITTADVLRIAKAAKRNRQTRRRFKGGRVSDLESFAAAGHRVGTIYADPPWLYQNQGTRSATRNHYDSMTVEELCALPVAQITADDAHLHLWTTNAFLFDCPKIFAAWGFEFRSSFVWVKPQLGIGNYWRSSHEFLLTAVRGNATGFDDRNLKSWLEADRTKHSKKPEEVRQMIERASPGPRMELFARTIAPGWLAWGHQISEPLLKQDHVNLVSLPTRQLRRSSTSR